MHQVYIALGSNLGDRKHNINEAIRLIGERVGTLVGQSSLLESEPWGFKSEHAFLNAAIHVETTLSPHEVLAATQQIEQSSKKWQKEIEALNTEAQTLYKNYQAEMVFLTDEQKKAKEKEIVAKENEASELKRKYFGNDGELFKKKERNRSQVCFVVKSPCMIVDLVMTQNI